MNEARVSGDSVKTLIGLGIPVVLLILSVLAIWFVETRLIALFGLRRTLLFRFLFAGVYAAGLAGLILADKSVSPLVGILYWLGGISWIALVWLSLAFIVSGAIASFTPVPASWAHGAALGTALTLTAWSIYSARDFVVATTEVALPRITRPLTIMHISDVHLGYHRSRDYLQKIVEATNHSQPDVVIINGDLLDSKVALDPSVLEPLKHFSAPVYFTGGNHEKYVDQVRTEELVAATGVQIMRNDIVMVKGTQLVGLRYMKADDNTLDLHPSDEKETIKSALQTMNIDHGRTAVFIHHSPVGIEYMAEKGADLVLSGHTHAGQVFPGTLLSPLFFAFNRGVSQIEKTKVLVSEGAGTYLTPMRSGSRNEINLIKLISPSEK